MAPNKCALRLAAFAAPWFLFCQAVSDSPRPDRTVTQVVKLLQGMMDQSKADGDSERDLFAKYKCYCDTNEASKTSEIEELTTSIGLLENRIEQLLATATELSKKLADSVRAINALEQDQEEARELREQEEEAWLTKNESLTDGIKQMKDAISELADVNADQTGGDNWRTHTAQDHTQYMSNYRPGASLSALKTTVRTALVAASALAGQRQISTINAFLQAPFTGTYSAQSGEVVGILKDMHDTFKANREEAEVVEEKADKAFSKYIAITDEEIRLLNASHLEANTHLGDNDGELSTKREQLEDAKEDLGRAKTFLSSLLSMLDAKTKQYNNRVALRRKEDTALAEAISILNSDKAFAAFGTVDSTSERETLQFVQLRAIHKHDLPAVEGPRRKAQAFLQRTAETQHSPMLRRIVSLLRTKNPFAVVLTEIDKMIGLIAAEGRADNEQQEWCDQERSETDQSIATKTGELSDLKGAINTLNVEIDGPDDGLLVTKARQESSLLWQRDNQISLAAERKEENLLYQADIRNLVNAEALLRRAIVVLGKYYSKISNEFGSAMLQNSTHPEPPSTWDDEYRGQFDSASNVKELLEVISANTLAEEEASHDEELSLQRDYERDMNDAKAEIEQISQNLADTNAELAEKRQELGAKKKDHAATEKEKLALENYLVKIKPGCDYITSNIDKRIENRQTETQALRDAKAMLKSSPAHAEAEAQAHQESLGACAEKCNREGEDNVICKACLAKVSVPGYCAGHAGTEGCA